MEEQRDSLLAHQRLAGVRQPDHRPAEAMNETIVGLALGENATQVQQLQTDLAEQQDLVAQWQQTAEDNRADLSGVDLYDADLFGADLSGADLSNANLYYANLEYANLSYAYLSNAYLYGADLSGADLSYADLSGADLSYADLSYADLSYADLSYADLILADLSDVVWYNTTCPDGTNSIDNGNTCENNL